MVVCPTYVLSARIYAQPHLRMILTNSLCIGDAWKMLSLSGDLQMQRAYNTDEDR